MSAELMLRYATMATDPDGDLDVRFENTINTPIDSITWRANGQAVAGTYVLDFHKVGAVVSVDVEATGGGATSRNPWGNRAGLAATADGATENLDIVPGVAIVLSASTAEGWQAKMTIGNYLSSAAAETEILEFEVVQAGTSSSGRRVACRNVGTEESEDTTIHALPGFYFDGTGAETFIERIAPHSDDGRHKLAGKHSHQVRFASWGDDIPSGKKKANIEVNTDGAGWHVAVTAALFDGITVYEYGVAGYDDANDYLAGLGITLPDTTADPTSTAVTLLVRDGYTWVQFAPDVTGSPGTYAAADLVLGDIPASDHEYFWVKVVVPSAAMPEDPCRMINVAARGLSI
jgi:hypothetical protein